MRILHVLSGFDIEFPGGITNYVRTLASEQSSAGEQVYVLDGSARRQWELSTSGYMVRGSKHSDGKHHVASTRKRPRASKALISLILEGGFDLIHFHLTLGFGTDFYDQVPGVGVPYFISLHDYHLICPRITLIDYAGKNCGGPERRKCELCIGRLEEVDLLYRASRKTGWQLPRIASSRVTQRNEVIEVFLREAAMVLAVSTRVRDICRRAYPDANYVVNHIGTASARSVRPSRDYSEGRLNLTFIGTLSKLKGAELLESIARGVHREDVSIQFFGRIERPELGERLAAAGVHLRGTYTPDDLPSIMEGTDIGLALPIWEDNAPQVVMEFLNFGVPVIATSMGGIPDFVNERNGFLFDPEHVDGVSEAIEFINDLNADKINLLRSGIESLRSPQEHLTELNALYVSALTAKRSVPVVDG